MATYPRRSGARAFTLVELMIVIAIIGILSSVAVPTFMRFQIRTKVTERTLVADRIKQAFQDKIVRDGSVSPASSGFLMGTYTPAYPPTTSKRTPNFGQSGWRDLVLEIDGNLYYTYLFMAFTNGPGGGETIYLYTLGDLDGDSQISWLYRIWETSNTGMRPYSGWPPEYHGQYPPPGQEDDIGPYRTF